MFNDKYSSGMEMFNLTHIITLVVMIAIMTTMVIFSKKIENNSKTDKILRYSVASSLLIFEIIYMTFIIVKGGASLDLIPLTGFCALTNLLTITYLLTNNKKLANMVFFYALTGSFFSLIFVETPYMFQHFRFFHYFYNHFVFLLAGVYCFRTKMFEINRKNFNRACLYLISYTLVVLVFDIILDQNWFFLFESPVKEISDFFGVLYTPIWLLAIYLLMNGWYFIFKYLSRFNNKTVGELT